MENSASPAAAGPVEGARQLIDPRFDKDMVLGTTGLTSGRACTLVEFATKLQTAYAKDRVVLDTVVARKEFYKTRAKDLAEQLAKASSTAVERQDLEARLEASEREKRDYRDRFEAVEKQYRDLLEESTAERRANNEQISSLIRELEAHEDLVRAVGGLAISENGDSFVLQRDAGPGCSSVISGFSQADQEAGAPFDQRLDSEPEDDDISYSASVVSDGGGRVFDAEDQPQVEVSVVEAAAKIVCDFLLVDKDVLDTRVNNVGINQLPPMVKRIATAVAARVPLTNTHFYEIYVVCTTTLRFGPATKEYWNAICAAAGKDATTADCKEQVLEHFFSEYA